MSSENQPTCNEAEPFVSVLIPVPTMNRHIRESLEYLRALEYSNFEVIILPNTVTDTETRWCDDARVKILPTAVSAPAAKRNIGATAARGAILAFLDDDAYPRADWLKNAVFHFRDPDVAAVGGPAVTAERDSVLAKVSGAVYASFVGGGTLRNRYLPVGRVRAVRDWPSVNLFVRKSTFIEIGGFQTHYWPGEDTALCESILNLGKKILYDPEILVWHHRRASFLQHLVQVYRYALHRGHFTKKFPRTSRGVTYMIPTVFVLSILCAPLLLPLHRGVQWLYAIIFSLYALLLLASVVREGARSKSVIVGILTLPLIILTHITYGIAFPIGLVKRELVR